MKLDRIVEEQNKVILHAKQMLGYHKRELTNEQKKAIEKFAMVLTAQMAYLFEDEYGEAEIIYDTLEPEIEQGGGWNNFFAQQLGEVNKAFE